MTKKKEIKEEVSEERRYTEEEKIAERITAEKNEELKEPEKEEDEKPLDAEPQDIPRDDSPDEDDQEQEKVEEAPDSAPEKTEEDFVAAVGDENEKPLDAEPLKSPVKKEGAPVPDEEEEFDHFCHRYINHPIVLQKISPAYRRAAAETVWKRHKAK